MNLDFLLLVAAATGCGLIGGLFFAFSNFVMKALGRLPAEQGAAAMQNINIVVPNPLFFTAFFGTGLVAVIAAALAALFSSGPAVAVSIAAAVLYVVGVIGVTVVFNVPLNEELARTSLADPALPDLWTRYLDVWTKWNHVRTVASLVAAVLFTVAAAS